jgi:lysophospholipase L1-like esterase
MTTHYLGLKFRKIKYAFYLGDSIVAAYGSGDALSTFITSNHIEIMLAVPGHTIAQQKTAWASATNKSSTAWVVIQVGINDVGVPSSASTIIAALQDLVNTVRAEIPSSAKIILCTMVPAKARLIFVLGAGPGAAAHVVWGDVNTAITGGGATPITGVDAVASSHTTDLNDGAGNLAAAYDQGDNVHTNNAGRVINAAAMQAAIVSTGIVL